MLQAAGTGEKEMEETNSGLVEEIKLLRSEKAKNERVLAKEKEDRKKAEEELKKRMGEEQRMLINEGEARMLELRRQVETLESRLSETEGEAYVARQQVEEIFEKYAGDKNIIIVEGDHNSPRPKFMFDSASIFLQTCLQIPNEWALQVPVSMNLMCPP